MADTILVTGGTGFIGGDLIEQLLLNGNTVHTTVRNAGKSEPILRKRWPDAGDRLKVFQADLENDEGWAEACAGCDAVAHVASPFPFEVPKNEDDLIIPARDGALRALRFAHEAGVKRFVLTSSSAAIAYGHEPSKTHFTKDDWTKTDSPLVAPYNKSKTVAERASREWVSRNAPDMVFCSINPTAVLGPASTDDLSTSIEMVKKMLDGSIPALPNMGIGVVDVRDVVKAHAIALSAPAEKVRDGRFPLQAEFVWMREMAESLRAEVPELSCKVAKRVLPDFLVKLLAPFMTEMKLVKTELGKVRSVDGEHSAHALGFKYLDARESLAASARSLADLGLLAPN